MIQFVFFESVFIIKESALKLLNNHSKTGSNYYFCDMIDYISGKIAELTPTMAVIENNGIGYSVEISLQTYGALEGKTEAKVYVQKQINPRDGTDVDYGFSGKEERELFRQITSVSGMGASSARMVLSSMNADELREAILSEDKEAKVISMKRFSLTD